MPATRTSTFTVIPAIDLRRGRVVRLEQGDFRRETTFGDGALDHARSFAAAGAGWLHVVDLDGAREGRPVQTAAVATIVAGVPGMSVQVAGGLRDERSIESALRSGAARVVLGTIAITVPSAVEAAIDRHGADRIAVALDVRAGRAVGGGWLADAPGTDALELLARLARLGVTTFIVTAIERDGLLGGPDLALLERCADATNAAVIASGGVATIDDLRAVQAIGCRGAIVGRALYDGRLDLGEAVRTMAADGID